MGRNSTAVLLAIVMAPFVLTRVNGKMYYVKSQDEDCALMNNCTCKDLETYLSNVSHYFRNNTTFAFLPGKHILKSKNISITNVKNLKLTGDNSLSQLVSNSCKSQLQPQIMCSGEAGFIFKNIRNLELSDLLFSNCGQPVPPDLYTHNFGLAYAALGFNSIQNLQLKSITVHNSSGYGVLTLNIHGNSKVVGCDLRHNRGSENYRGGNALFNYSECSFGRAKLTINDSIFSHGGYNHKYNDSQYTGVLATGIAVTISCSNIKVLLHNVTARKNTNNHLYGHGGNMFVDIYNYTGYATNNYLCVRNSRFLNGSAPVSAGLGVALFVRLESNRNATDTCVNIVDIEGVTITGNRASGGCGLYIDYKQQLCNNNCTANIHVRNSRISSNVVTFKRKSPAQALYNVGVGMAVLNGQLCSVSITNSSTFIIELCNTTIDNNSLVTPDDQKIASGSASLYIENFTGHFKIRNCTFRDNRVTAISIFQSSVSFKGNITISNNTGVKGGGMIICESSNIILTPNTSISFVKNHALLVGGGIFAEEQCANSAPLCFYQIDMEKINCSRSRNVSKLVQECRMGINMKGNTAEFAGNHIYGGSISHCHIHSIPHQLKRVDFHAMFKFQKTQNDLSRVSSDPRMACFCEDSMPNCSLPSKTYGKVFPGQNVTLPMIIVGQNDGSVPSSLRVNTTNNTIITQTELNCTNVTFTPLSHDYSNVSYKFEVLTHPHFNPNFSIGQAKYLTVMFKKCPNGFKNEGGMCDCDKKWDRIDCNFEDLTLTRHPPAWLGIVDGNVVYQDICPYSYCLKGKHGRGGEVVLRIENDTFDSDKQCRPYRTGVLCGMCVKGYSLSLSSSACVDCSRHSTASTVGYVIGTLLFGVGLILLFTACNLTITDGMLSGFLFYANIFKINSFIFNPNFNPITVIMSWINLDFQLTECFYNGFSAYGKSWLEFCFPLYLWALVAIIILLSGRFDRVAKLFGGNTVKVLATLIELSYSGLVQAVVIALSSIRLSSSNHTQTLHWFYDANIHYLSYKHVPLFLVAIVFGFLILAHTLLLLFVQPLQRWSGLYCLLWVAKLKPLIDAYTSPHIIRDRCRWWPGLLLFTRLVLIIIFMLNTKQSENINKTAITVACLLLLTIWAMGGIYKKTYLNILNSFFIINLGVLSLLYKNGKVALSHYSASLAILTMFCVLVYHMFLRGKALYKRWRMKKFFMRTPFDMDSGVRDTEVAESASILPRY